MCVCLPAVCWSGPAKSHGRGGGTVQPLSLSLPCGEERVKRYELLPGDVVAAEKEALQAGQAFPVSLERERERGTGKRARGRHVKKRRYLGREHCIVTVVRALYPLHSLSHLAALSSSSQHPHPSCACTHTHIKHAALSAHGEEGQ